MTLLRDITKELLGMFLADARLTGGTLLLVAIVGALAESHAVRPLVVGVALLIGCPGVVVMAAWRESRRRLKPWSPEAIRPVGDGDDLRR